MKKYSYYPGCTLKTQAKELDASARRAAEALGFTLDELENWQCCGGVYPTSRDELATKLSSVRALAAAEKNGGILVTLCSACHNVIKQTNDLMINDPEKAQRVNNYLGPDDAYGGGTKVMHYLEVLRDEITFDAVAERVTAPLTGKKIAAYYGCLLLRPGKVMQMDDPENPHIMEDFISSLGADAVVYPMRNECAEDISPMEDPSAANRRSLAVLQKRGGCRSGGDRHGMSALASQSEESLGVDPRYTISRTFSARLSERRSEMENKK